MALYRTTVCVAAGLLVLLAGLPAPGQTLMDGQVFAPADLSPYGSGIQPNEGYFFRFDGLHWAISKPTATTIGFEGLTRLVFYGPYSGDPTNPPSGPEPGVLQQDSFVQSNTMDTGELRSTFTDGNRIEFGRVTNRNGWIFGVYKLNNQTQRLAASDVDMVFFDPAFGPQGARLLQGVVGQIQDPQNPDDPDATIDVIRDLPLKFDDVFVRNSVEHWSTELMCIHRTRPFHRGGRIEFFAGLRYMEFDDTFSVDARGEEPAAAGDDDDDPQQVPAILADSFWSTEAENHIVGPQLGVRYFKICSRFMINLEGRCMAGYNFQSLRQRGTLGTELNPPGGPTGDDDDDDDDDLFEPRLMGPTSFNHAAHMEEFSPVVEVRAEFRYKLTRAVDVGAGWTGIWIDNVARASNMINYEVPDMGLRTLYNRQNAFAHGVSFTITVNR